MKRQGKSKGLRRHLLCMMVTLLFYCSASSAPIHPLLKAPDRGYFDIVKSIDLFGEVYRELSKSYVDSLNVSELMYAGIDGMLHTLDPYTVFLDKEDSGELDEMTNGQYVGIGITIAPLDGATFITSVVDGYPAANAGIRAGDRILEINDREVGKTKLDQVKKMIKGSPGTSMKLRIERQGSTSFTVNMTRQEVRVSAVSYSSIIDGTGYVEMKSFGARSADELRGALQSLLRQAAEQHQPLKGIILDLRNNPGGLLNVAVDVASLFVRKGSLVVSIRGRSPESDISYVTTTPPLDAALPLVVLINSESASAAEIVAGAIQDLDRGVIVGERSYGKGLVQSVVRISYDSALKLTTAKYYTPSGRLIQKESEPASQPRHVVPKGEQEKLSRVFYTKGKRTVYGGGGIMPDISTPEQPASPYLSELVKQGMLFLFSTEYCATHPVMPSLPIERKSLLASFGNFLSGRKFLFKSEAETRLEALKESMKSSSAAGNEDKGVKSLGEVQLEVERLKEQEIARESEAVAQSIEEEIIRHYSEPLARKAQLTHDPVVKKAIEILSDSRRYSAALHP